MSVRLAVFASGGGSNLQALIESFTDAEHVGVELVISDRAESGALQRAAAVGIPAQHVRNAGRAQDEIARDILDALTAQRIDLIALAGYLRLVPGAVIAEYRGRILNIHPSLLPSFGGAGMYGRRVHEAVLAAGCTVTGATVHHVDERYDEGRIVAQWPVPVLPDDTPEVLAARVLRVEHRLYPAVIDALVRGVADSRAGPMAGAESFALIDATVVAEHFALTDAAVVAEHDMIKIARI